MKADGEGGGLRVPVADWSNRPVNSGTQRHDERRNLPVSCSRGRSVLTRSTGVQSSFSIGNFSFLYLCVCVCLCVCLSPLLSALLCSALLSRLIPSLFTLMPSELEAALLIGSRRSNRPPPFQMQIQRWNKSAELQPADNRPFDLPRLTSLETFIYLTSIDFEKKIKIN